MKSSAFTSIVLALVIHFGAIVSSPAREIKVLACEVPIGKELVMKLAEEIRAEDPELVLVQGARSWSTCSALAQHLKPTEYHILTCSAFGPPRPGVNAREVGILSKQKGYYAWTERYDTNFPASGFAFAAVNIGTQSIAVASMQFSRGTQSVSVAEQLIEHAASIANWATNNPFAMLVMSSGKIGGRTTQDSIQRVFWGAGFGRAQFCRPDRIIFSQPPGAATFLSTGGTTNFNMLVASLDLSRAKAPLPKVVRPIAPAVVAGQGPVAKTSKPTNDLNSASETASKAPLRTGNSNVPVTQALASPPTQPATPKAPLAPLPDAVPAPTVKTERLQAWIPWVAGGMVGLCGVSWLALRKRRRRSRLRGLIAEGSVGSTGSYVVVAPASATASGSEPPLGFSGPIVRAEGGESTRTQSAGLSAMPSTEEDASRAGMMQWLKQEFVKRLVGDRSALLNQQSEAALKADQAARRLAALQERIDMQNEVYLRRIDELTRELGAAREENRELIRFRIAQVRADMEAARTRILKEGQ